MKRITLPIWISVLIVGSLLTACTGLLPGQDGPVTGDFGSPLTAQERHQRTFDALWKNVQENYIYFDSANVDWEALQTRYTDRIQSGLTEQEFEALLRELESDLPDGALIYQSREERIAADIADNSSYGGIGAYIGFEPEPVPHIVILAVMKGSPAEKAGILAHDSLLAIDGDPVLLEEGLDAVKRVRGPAGTTVALTVQSPGKAERVVQVTRAQLVGGGALATSQVDGTKFGYILVPPVAYNGMSENVASSLQNFADTKTFDGLILDLRVAGSSGAWPLDELLTLFHDGAVGEYYNRADQQDATITGRDLSGSQTVPLVVLVGGNTNGMPEILAGVLQQAGRATIIGEASPGAIEGSDIFHLPDGSRVFLETTSFRLTGGGELGNNGVQPDVPVEAGWDEVQPNNDPVIKKAIEILEAQQ